MPAPIIPWQPSNIPIEIQQELDRRKTVRSFQYIANNKASWTEGGDWNTYKGPLMPWVRLCSNSAGPLNQYGDPIKSRFVFHGGKGFYQTYGFQPPGFLTETVIIDDSAPGSTYQIIGYTPTNPPYPHTISNSLKNPTFTNSTTMVTKEVSNYPIHIPTPEISKITVTVQKELYRRAEIEWTCFSWEQLTYMTPYFLIPGISVMLEFGWNHFNPVSLVKSDDENKMAKLWRNAYPLYINNIILSKGNYDVLYGIITNFNWSIDNNRINCMTEITSKDRLYAGISKDMGITVNDNSSPDQPRPVYQALRDFISKDATLLNLKTIAEAPNPFEEIVQMTGENNYITGSINGFNKFTPLSRKGITTQNIIWRDIIKPILSEPDPKVRGMKGPYIRGVFSGRPKKFFNEPEGLGKPGKCDFDKSNAGKLDRSKVWINMGMIVEILNYFSNLDGGSGEPMFQVDIMGSVIGGHINMISCNRDVLIPNSRSPKCHYGIVGLSKYGPKSELHGSYPIFSPNESTPYESQYALYQLATSPADKTLHRVCYQSLISKFPTIIPTLGKAATNTVCYREDIDYPINFLRYEYLDTPYIGPSNLGYKSFLKDFSFPAIGDVNLPVSPNDLGKSLNPTDPNSPMGNVMEADVSGLLSNIYLSYSAFVSAIEDPDPKTASYVDIYRKILTLLNDSVDGFWDLALVEQDNILTIVDKNYIGTQKGLGQNDPTYTFDYYDADSIIRSLKFNPQLSDVQATRAIYGETNNGGSKYVMVDPNDLLNYQFKDAIVMNKKIRSEGDHRNDLEKRRTAQQQIKDIIGEVQKLSVAEDDPTLQMTINKGGTQIHTSGLTVVAPGIGISTGPSHDQDIESGPFEYLKLCLPPSVAKQMFRLLIDDKDEDNNQRYCAIQPGIDVQLTLQGIGGLRTFQYFLIKNLPSPYSHHNIIFRIINVVHTISQEGGGWETKITAGILPLRNYIKRRLTQPKGGWAIPVNATTS